MNIITKDYYIKLHESFKYAKNADIYTQPPDIDTHFFIKLIFQYFPIYYIPTIGKKFFMHKFPLLYDFLNTLNFDIIIKKNNLISSGYIGAKQIVEQLIINNNSKIHIYSYLTTYLYCFLDMGSNKSLNLTLYQISLNDGNDYSASNIRTTNLKEFKTMFGEDSFILQDKITDFSVNNIISYINNIPKANIIIYNYHANASNTNPPFHEFNHYVHTVIALNTLEIGGSFVFYYRDYSINYLKQLNVLLYKYFEKITTIVDETYLYPYNFYFIYTNLKSRLSNEDNDILMNILDKWNTLLDNKKNNYSSILLQTKHKILNYDNTIHTDNFVTNLFNFTDIYNTDTYPCEIDNLIDSIFYTYIRVNHITNKLNSLINYLNNDILIKFNKDNYNNNIVRSVKYCKKYNIPINPKFIDFSNDNNFKLKPPPLFLKYKLNSHKNYNISYNLKNKYTIDRLFVRELILYNYLYQYYDNTFYTAYTKLFIPQHKTQYKTQHKTQHKTQYNNINKWHYYIDFIIETYGLEKLVKKQVYSTNHSYTNHYSDIIYSIIPLNIDLFLGFFETESYNYNIGSINFFIDEYSNLKKLLLNCINILNNVKLDGSAILEINLPLNEGITFSVICLLEMFFREINIIKFTETEPFEFTIFIIAKNKLKMPNIKLINFLMDKLNNFDLYDELLDSNYYNSEIVKINDEMTKDIINKYVATLSFIL